MTTSITRDQLRFAIAYGSAIVVDTLPAAPYSQTGTMIRPLTLPLMGGGPQGFVGT